MSQEQLARLAANLDDVEVVHNANPWPIPGTRAEKRAERAVALWFLISAVCGVAFLVAFLFWPHEYVRARRPRLPGLRPLHAADRRPARPGRPRAGRRGDPVREEVLPGRGLDPAAPRRAVGRGRPPDGHRADRPGRQGHRVRPPQDDPGHAPGWPPASSASGSASPRSPRWCATRGRADRTPRCGTPAGAAENGETVYLRYDTGDPEEIVLVRPEDQEPGSMMTVFPFRESERGNEHALLEGVRRADNPAMLIRLRPGTVFVPAPGHEGSHLRRLRGLLEDLHPPGLPGVAVRGADQPHPVPVPPVAVRRDRVRPARSSVRPPGRCRNFPLL